MGRRSSTGSGTLRIIGGRWRGRKLVFPALEGLRPTPDRVRETLFNWLGPDLPGARCLDLFAGSGALGLEALSRGAAEVVFVDSQRPACRAIEDHLALLECPDGQVCQRDALEWLGAGRGGRDAFDIVFLDPPFGSPLLTAAAQALEAGDWLRDSCLLYTESGRRHSPPELPENWDCRREKVAGDVCYRLFVRAPRFD